MAVETQTYQGSQQQYGVVIDHDAICYARDGTPLTTSLYFPAIDGKRAPGTFPTVMERTPYDRHRLNLHNTGIFFARRGYVVALQDIRGRGGSGGEYRHLYNHPTEASDGYDACEWIAEQEWSDGKVGTFGISHTGATQQALALGRPPHLVTQVVGDTAWNYFRSSQRPGGAMRAILSVPNTIRLARTSPYAKNNRMIREALDRDLRRAPELIKKLPLRPGTTALRFAPTYEEWLQNTQTRGLYDDYWRNPGASVEDFVDDYPDIPILFYSSWFGHHPAGNFTKFVELTKRHQNPVKLIFGVWTHGWGMIQVTTPARSSFAWTPRSASSTASACSGSTAG